MSVHLSAERADEIGEMLSIYFISKDGISTNDELYESFKKIAKRIPEISQDTGISVDELFSFGFWMVENMLNSREHENITGEIQL